MKAKTYKPKIEVHIGGNEYGKRDTSIPRSMNTDLEGYVIADTFTVCYVELGFFDRTRWLPRAQRPSRALHGPGSYESKTYTM